MRLAFSLALIAMAAAVSAQAQVVNVLHSFTGADGATPVAGLVTDTAGNLYGTTEWGGTVNLGTVFELVNSAGSYTEKVLYSFTGSGGDGKNPLAGLVMDAAGNLYGTTYGGGISSPQCFGTCGTVFELVNSSGNYTEKVLYSFTGGSDGGNPWAGLIMDVDGNLYGTTSDLLSDAGTAGATGSVEGAVFELLNSAGNYTVKVLHSFTGSNGDGQNPVAGLIMDADGNLFGTTYYGGTYGTGVGTGGTVFELVKSPGGYTEKVLYSFGGAPDGGNPAGGVVLDASGNIYSTTFYGGDAASGSCLPSDCGTVFELVNASGSYSERVLYNFAGDLPVSGNAPDGQYPFAGLIIDAAGNLYGTTSAGGQYVVAGCRAGCGTVFELLNSSGSYTEKVLHNFVGPPGDGAGPYAGLVTGPSGYLYATSSGGGTDGYGTVFVLNLYARQSTVVLSSNSLNLGSEAVGTDSPAQSVTLINAGTDNLIFGLGAVTLSGANAAEFELSADSCSGATVAVGGTCSASVIFSPSVLGLANATLTFTDNATNNPQALSLTGTGFNGPAVSLSPGVLNFGSQELGTVSAAQTVTVSNVGNQPLTFSSITISGSFGFGNPPAQPPSPTCSVSTPLAPGSNCVVYITFGPAVTGPLSGLLSFTDNALGSPQNLDLSGTGIALTSFTLSMAPGSPSTQTVTAGQSATYKLSVAPTGGFNQTISFTCTGAPDVGTCTILPSSVTLDGKNAAALTVTLTTTAWTVALPRLLAPLIPGGWLALLLGVAALLALVALPKARRGAARGRPAPLWLTGLLTAILLVTALSSSCGGGGVTSHSPGTWPGLYNTTVTGTSGGVTNSIVLTLQVQK
jgi:uncharacterized repeat protein (TIGR03803 family)